MFFAGCFSCIGQDSLRHFQSFNAGLGVSFGNVLNSESGVNAALNYYYSFGKESKGHTLQFGFSFTGSYAYMGFAKTLYSASIGYGRTFMNRWGIVGGYAAPSLFFGREPDNFITGGIHVCIQTVFLPIKDVGLGLEYFSQLNLIQSSIGIRAVLHFNNNSLGVKN